MKVTSNKINEIAQELETGMKVYLNRETLEIKSILDWEDISDGEFWEEELEEIFKGWSDFVVLTKMESWEAFKVMEEFIDTIEDVTFCEGLVKILSRRSPFANFKAEIESSPYRQNWFDFKLRKYEDYVREQLENENFSIV
jgi:hypothetical protein